MSNPQALNNITDYKLLNNTMTCEYIKVRNSNDFWKHRIIKCTTAVLLMQIVLIFVATRTIYFLLRPFHQTTIIAQIIAGIIIGPSFLGEIAYLKWLFPLPSRYILRTVAEFGMIFHVFVLGVQMDVGLIKHTRRRAVIIGLSGCLFPIIFGMSTFHIVQQNIPLDVNLASGIPASVVVNAVTSVVVITSTLKELNILNSELGRLASSTALVADLFGLTANMLLTCIKDAHNNSSFKPLLVFPVLAGYYLIMFLLLRPLTLWIVSQTSDGESIKQSHFIAIMCVVLALAFVGSCLGHPAGFCAFVFGLSLPDGPPLGSQLVQKFEFFTSTFLVPVFCAISGMRTELYLLNETPSSLMELIIIMAYLGKFAGTILPSLCFGMSFLKGSCLALIMSCRGIVEIAIYDLWNDKKFINPQIFTILVTNMVFITGIATAIVGYIYDPSRRYKLDARRTIVRSQQSNLRILVCINSNENVSPIISLLEVSNPSRNSPITAFVLQLIELKGSVTAFLKPHNQRTDSLLTSSRHIINAFNKFQRCYLGNVVVQHFTTIAPYESMHDDICTLALDKRAAIIIIPFHKQWGVGIGTLEEFDLSIRALNGNVLSNAPCSVGVLVHRGQIKGIKPKFSGQLLYHIALLFIGGADDREALAYSRRIAEHQNISLTIVWFKTYDSNILAENVIDLDNEVINELKYSVVGKKIIFKEEVVKNGLGTMEVIQSLKENHDLFIVGKHHEPDSQVILGLSEWIEYPELGIVGDTLVSSNDKFSVLVVQEKPEEIGPKLKHLESGS